jgi:hypothetical protein
MMYHVMRISARGDAQATGAVVRRMELHAI